MSILQTNSRNGLNFLIVPIQVVRVKGFRKGNPFVITETKNGITYVHGSGKGAVKLQRSGDKGSYYFILPKKIMERHGWAKGDSFVLSDIKNGVKFTRGEIR